jgi:hypothetical protein
MRITQALSPHGMANIQVTAAVAPAGFKQAKAIQQNGWPMKCVTEFVCELSICLPQRIITAFPDNAPVPPYKPIR